MRYTEEQRTFLNNIACEFLKGYGPDWCLETADKLSYEFLSVLEDVVDMRSDFEGRHSTKHTTELWDAMEKALDENIQFKFLGDDCIMLDVYGGK